MARRAQRKRQIRRAKKTLRRSGSVKRSRARHTEWTARAEQDWDDLSYDVIERVMPRDERDRRRQIEQAITAARQPAPDDTDDPDRDSGGSADAPRPAPAGRRALVTEVAGMAARIELEGEQCPATVRGLLTEMVRDGWTQRERTDRTLLHIFQHQVHHRGQVHAMLAGTSVKPPQLDEFFCESEDDLRREDFAALGFEEAAIWR